MRVGEKMGDYTILHKYDPRFIDDFRIEIYSVGIHEENGNCYTQVNTGIIIKLKGKIIYKGLKYKRLEEHVYDIQQSLLSKALGIG